MTYCISKLCLQIDFNSVVFFFILFSQSDGIAQTKLLAAKHTEEAVKLLQHFTSSDFQKSLVQVTEQLLTRQK